MMWHEFGTGYRLASPWAVRSMTIADGALTVKGQYLQDMIADRFGKLT
jgi:hypothetical protein